MIAVVFGYERAVQVLVHEGHTECFVTLHTAWVGIGRSEIRTDTVLAGHIAAISVFAYYRSISALIESLAADLAFTHGVDYFVL